MFSDFKIDELDETCGVAGSDLFSMPPTCVDLKETSYIEIPMDSAGLSDSCSQPVEFAFKGTPGVYMDLKNSQVYLTCVLEHRDGSPLSPHEKVAPVNYLRKSSNQSVSKNSQKKTKIEKHIFSFVFLQRELCSRQPTYLSTMSRSVLPAPSTITEPTWRPCCNMDLMRKTLG